MANSLTTSDSDITAEAGVQANTVPPLENADRLTRAEFERRYRAMPQLKKAELIEGVVHMPSPVRHVQHGGPHLELNGWLWTYQAATPGIEGSSDATLRLDLDNELQPDGMLFIRPECGGRVRVDSDGYLSGNPELIGEVSSSSASIDVGTKLQVYRRNQVQEYVVWRVLDEAVDWFVFREGNYERASASSDGILKSEVFPGLWLDAAALIRRDRARVLEVLHAGLASQEHKDFIARLQSR